MRKQLHFALQFEAKEIDALVERYGPAQDDDALYAGSRIASGDYSMDNLRIIVKWKPPRRAALIDNNNDDDIAVALQFAAAPTTPEAMAVAVLTALHGVGIRMTSAVLTAISPDRYTVLDYRALESLGITNGSENFSFYVTYLEACRELAMRHGKSLRNLDRALWQWSWEKSTSSNQRQRTG